MVLDRFRLEGRTALVTGGGQGIGRALAHALGEAGAAVAVADLDLGRAERVASELQAKQIPASSLQADVADEIQVRDMVAAVVDRFGALDIALNNAGVNFNSAAEVTSLEEWDTTFAINLRVCFSAARKKRR